MGMKKVTVLPKHDSLSAFIERFNEFFMQKIVAIRQNMYQEESTFSPSVPVGETVSSMTVPDLSNFTPATMQEAEKLITRSPAKSCGLDPVPTWLLKQHAECLVPIITSIVKLSLSDGVFPDQFKTAHVCPLIKKAMLDCNALKNYGPVSNLPYISNIVEKVVAARLQKHLQDNQLYEPMQSAYRPAHSTETPLVRVTNDLLRAVDKQQAGILVILDLSAVFDTVDHNILLQRLHEEIGVCGVPLQWFESYLTGRKQAITINKISSSECDLIYGVPQGSVLGPILFTCYTMPIGAIVRKHGLGLHMYADDIQLYISFKPVGGCDLATERIEACVTDMRSRMYTNKLQLNDTKTAVMVICSVHNQSKFNVSHIQVGDSEIQAVSVVRSIGAHLDETLNMRSRVNSLCRRAHFYLRNISKIL